MLVPLEEGPWEKVSCNAGPWFVYISKLEFAFLRHDVNLRIIISNCIFVSAIMSWATLNADPSRRAFKCWTRNPTGVQFHSETLVPPSSPYAKRDLGIPPTWSQKGTVACNNEKLKADPIITKSCSVQVVKEVSLLLRVLLPGRLSAEEVLRLLWVVQTIQEVAEILPHNSATTPRTKAA